MTDAPLTPEQWLTRHREAIEAANQYGWEILFAEEVLVHLFPNPVADMSFILPQRDLVLDGRKRQIDFAIEFEDVRIAVELDGREKLREELPRWEYARFFEDWQSRERALVLRGYRVMRFANTEFGRPQGSELRPRSTGVSKAVQQLQALIRNEKAGATEKARAYEVIDARRELETLRAQQRADQERLQSALQQSESERASASAALNDLGKALHKRERELAAAASNLTKSQADLVAALELLEQAGASSVAADVERATIGLAEGRQPQEELDQLVTHSREQEARIADLEQALANANRKEEETERDMKWVAIAMLGLAVSLVVAVLVLSLGDGGNNSTPSAQGQAASPDPTERPSPSPIPTATAVAASAGCDGTLDWLDVADCLGEPITFRGRIVATTFNETAAGGPAFLNIGNEFPRIPRVTLVIWESCRDDFIDRTGFPPEEYYRGTEVVVAGTAELYNGQPQVDLCAPGNSVSGD